jgi:glycosyltransferase involved in cell wall biosynthesis
MTFASDTETFAKTAEPLRNRDILCFSHDWTGDPLSKTHLMRVLSKHNRILWVNAIANRMPTASSKDMGRIFKKLKSFIDPIKEVEPNIFVMNPLAIPAYGLAPVVNLNRRSLISQVKRAMKKLGFSRPINMTFNPAAGMVAGKVGEDQLIYYCVDEYTAFTGVSPGLKKIEEDLFRRADLVIVSADKLYESKKHFNPNTFIIPHGVDYAHFSRALDDDTEIPAYLAELPRPIIGFHGLLADWVDFELLKKVALHFWSGSMVLLGKVTVDAEEKIKILRSIPNIHQLGRQPYADLPAYCKGFDVALNPFVINELTESVNPLKVREYLAAGLPVVSTNIPEMKNIGGCRVAKDQFEFIRMVEDALENPGERSAISASMKNEGWEARVARLREIMGRVESAAESATQS